MVGFVTEVKAGQSLRIMVSVSEPDTEDLRARGLSEIHVQHVFIEVVRHLLAAGHSIAYGGDLRLGGYTEAIVDLLRTYRRQDLDPPSRFRSYLAWPAQRSLDPEAIARMRSFSTLVLLDRPANAPDIEVADATPEQLIEIARGYSMMREQIVSESDCLVIVGGRTHGQVGLVPGVQEEAWLALQKPMPVFISGGYGGSATALADALSGRKTPMLSTDYHVERTPTYLAHLNEARRTGGEVLTPERIGEALIQSGWTANRNGLSLEENERLAVTDDVDEIIALILRGVRQSDDS